MAEGRNGGSQQRGRVGEGDGARSAISKLRQNVLRKEHDLVAVGLRFRGSLGGGGRAEGG